MTFSPYPSNHDHEGWWFIAQILVFFSDKYIPGTQIEGINLFSHGGEASLQEHCQTKGITPQEFDDVPTYLRNKEK